MSCFDCNEKSYSPCGEHPYDDCGCINPTSFPCVDIKKDLPNLDLKKDSDTGGELLDKLDAFVGEMKGAKGKVLLNEDDTCPGLIGDKLEAGMNISLSYVGVGCEKRLRIDATEGGIPVDVSVKATASDTTASYLNDKVTGGTFISKSISNVNGEQKVKLDVSVDSIISADAGNMLEKGADGGLKTKYTAPDGSETKIIAGAGANVTGLGTPSTPYIIALEGAVSAVKTCFDGVWRDFSVNTETGSAGVTHNSSAVKYRIRFDGTIEFRGSASFTVAFSEYSSANRKFTVALGSLPTTCLTAPELAGVADLKNVNYIDIPQASVDQITQMYGYIVKKNSQNIIVDFQSSFTNATSKTIVISFDGVVIHPNI